MKDQILDAPAGVQTQMKYAGFWIRFAALIIDAIILSLVYGIIMFLFMGGLTNPEPSVIPIILLTLIGVGYFTVMESSSRQGTIGKRAVGIKVGNANGGQISFANALGRYFAKIISSAILYIGYLMAGWDPKKQALHDKIAHTYVFYA